MSTVAFVGEYVIVFYLRSLTQIGLGRMGLGMATNLQKHFEGNNLPGLMYYNRTMSKGDVLKERGAIASSLEQIAKTAKVIFLCLANDQVVLETFSSLLSSPEISGALIVDCSTVHPDTSKECQRLVLKSGARFIASPVFGASPVARAGKLIFVPCGVEQDVESIKQYIIGIMGVNVLYLGEDVSKALRMKITGNTFIIGLMELIGEVEVFGEKVGIEPSIFEEFLRSYFGPVLATYSERLTGGVYLPGGGKYDGISSAIVTYYQCSNSGINAQFLAAHGLKDVTHSLNLSKEYGAEFPIMEICKSNIQQAIETKGQNIDTSAVYGVLRTKAGLDFETDSIKKRDAKD